MDKNLLLTISAFSGLAGALLTQLLTGLFSYVSDRRKHKLQLDEAFRFKKLDIGENFYYINGELMTMVRKNIDYWYSLRQDKSEQTLGLMKREMDKMDAYQAKLHTDNWKYNLVGVYFKVPFSFDEIQKANTRSHTLYISVVDISHKIRNSDTGGLEELYGAYNVAIFDLCSHYEQLYSRMQENMTAVSTQLLAEFGKG